MVKMSENMMDKERRKGIDRRLVNAGPPVGFAERRVNIERRLFNLGVDCVNDWLKLPSGHQLVDADPGRP